MKFTEKERNVILNCPVCADTLFSYDDEILEPIKCNSCSSEFMQDEILEANVENISQHKKEMLNKAVNDVKTQIQKDIKNIFKNSKFKVK